METTRKCPTCGNEYKVDVGMNKGNLKNLLKKPSFSEVMVLVMLILTLALAYSYFQETKQAKYMMNHLDEVCFKYSSEAVTNSIDGTPRLNFSMNSKVKLLKPLNLTDNE